MSESTNPIEREVIGVASSKVKVLAVELELVSRHSDKLGAAAGFARGSSSREGQDAGGKEGRGRKMHGDGPGDVERSLATRSNSTGGGAMVLIFNAARPVVEIIRIHTTESVGPPPQERGCLAETWQARMLPYFAAVFPARSSSTQAVGCSFAFVPGCCTPPSPPWSCPLARMCR